MAPGLSLASLKKRFHLFVNIHKGTALGVLIQEGGGKKQPMAYLCKFLDPKDVT
jgi:hypothetical protein